MYFIFVFKQKTAYEMRISDWSSDVCSSDLERLHEHAREFDEARIARRDELRRRARLEPGAAIGDLAGDHRAPHPKRAHDLGLVEHRLLSGIGQRHRAVPFGGRTFGRALVEQCEAEDGDLLVGRSEEHTSELQSLMRISYAVFCLKKKKTAKHTHKNQICTQK